MSKSPCIWLTRPLTDSTALAEALAKHGIESIIAPVMQIESVVSPTSSQKPDALLLTSRHAAHALLDLPRDWRALPVFAVGAATAEAARAASFTSIREGNDGVLALLPQIAAHVPAGSRVLYLAGDEVSADVVTLLGAREILVEQVTVYRAVAAASLPDALVAALARERVTGAVFFSTRSAQLAITLMTQHGITKSAAHLDTYCLSLAVAQAAGGLAWRGLHACHQPTVAAMVELVVSCNVRG